MELTVEAAPDTCSEYLGDNRGRCPRPARTTDNGFPFCWSHRDERAAWRERVWGIA